MAIREYPTTIVGVKFKNNDGTSRQRIISRMKENEPVYLRAYDYQGYLALAVDNKRGQQIGNIAKDRALMIYRWMQSGEYSHAYIREIKGGMGNLSYGVDICLVLK